MNMGSMNFVYSGIADKVTEWKHDWEKPYLLGTNEGHGFNKRENQDYQFFAMIEFLRRYLLPEQATAATAAAGRQ